MPPKRRGAQAKPAPPSSAKPAPPAPPPAPAPAPAPPPPPPESDAARVRKEWSKFIDVWYEPQKKKLVEKLQKELLAKYGHAKNTQKLREMELFERLDSIAQQLAQPARKEWERRLDLAQLHEDQWNDMSGEEQQAVMSVFVGFFDDAVDDMGLSASIEEEESIVEEVPYRPHPPPVPPAPSRQTIPPTPTRQTFECVHPTSFFVDNMTPPNPAKNLPALSMDHLAALGPSNAGRSADPVSAGVSGILGFQNWASEAGIVTQQPPSVKPPAASTLAQSLSARPRAADMSRQTSAASTSSSPPLKTTSPQYSPPNPTTKFSPPINTENLALGKRYIGPVIMEEDSDPLDEDLLRSKMAAEYQQYKISLRIQMIYQFHAEAAEVEIKLFETLLADAGTKESRARAVQEHETSMMRLREQKEEERKRLCAEEREKRREEIRQHLAQRRAPQNREVDKPNPPKFDKASAQQRPGKATHQKENVPLSQPPAASSSKLEPPSIMKRSNSALSQDEASANEALFANAMAMMQTKAGPAVLTPAQASLNESLFSNAAAMLAAQSQPGSSGKATVQPPSIMKKSNSARSQDYDVPQITVSFAEPLTAPAAPEPAQVPPTTAKGKKGKKGQPAQQPPLKPVTITEDLGMEMDGEPPPPGQSLWDAATVAAKNVWDVASASMSTSKPRPEIPVEEARTPDPVPVPSKGSSANAKKAVPTSKKGKKVTIIEEPDVDADPVVSPPPTAKTKATQSAWGSANGKAKATPAPAEEIEVEPPALPPLATPARGKKAAEVAPAKSAQKPHLKVAISEELESEIERDSAPARTNRDKPKSAWGVSAAIPSASTSAQAGKLKATQQQVDPRRGATSSSSKSVRADTVPNPEELPKTVAGESTMPGTLEPAGPDEDEDDADASAWFNPDNMSYWANFMGQPEAKKEEETLAVPQSAIEQTGKHVRWTPTVSGESDDEEFGEADEELATSMWMQYAISGGDIPALGGPEAPHVMPSESVQRETSVWEQGRGKKKVVPTTVDPGNRVQQTSVFDRAALAGQWPKMESWLSPPARGQNSGSTRVF